MFSAYSFAQEERYRITSLLRIGCNQAAIAAALGLARSTVSRELLRYATRRDGRYRVEALIKRKCSPEQVVTTLKASGLFCISHETIYRHVLQGKKAGNNEPPWLDPAIPAQGHLFEAADAERMRPDRVRIRYPTEKRHAFKTPMEVYHGY